MAPPAHTAGGLLHPVPRHTVDWVSDGRGSDERRRGAEVGKNCCGVFVAGGGQLVVNRWEEGEGKGGDDGWSVGGGSWQVHSRVLGYEIFNSSTQDSHPTRTANEAQTTKARGVPRWTATQAQGGARNPYTLKPLTKRKIHTSCLHSGWSQVVPSGQSVHAEPYPLSCFWGLRLKV